MYLNKSIYIETIDAKENLSVTIARVENVLNMFNNIRFTRQK